MLVTGGVGANAATLASAELYDKQTRTWSLAGSMATARVGHTATLLNSGKVLVVGGQGPDGQVTGSAELYDPQTGTWTSAGSLATACVCLNGEMLHIIGSVFERPERASAPAIRWFLPCVRRTASNRSGQRWSDENFS